MRVGEEFELRRKRRKIFDITETTLDRALNKAERYASSGNDVQISTGENGKIKLTSIKKEVLRKTKTSKRRLRRSLQ